MTRLRELREAGGLSQTELAARAGVSRQLVGATEAGRHLPRVDAALALADVLAVDVGILFGRSESPSDAVTGGAPSEGSLVRIGRVGSRVVTAPARVGADGFDLADGRIDGGDLALFGRARPGIVAAGCEPGLETMERILRLRGAAAVTVSASTDTSIRSLEAGRLHAAVVHGPLGAVPPVPGGLSVERFHLSRWLVGLAAPAGSPAGWWGRALSGEVPVVQREAGAGVQGAFERARGANPPETPGPRVASHLESVRRALATGMPAVTIEPAAAALAAEFHPLEEHEAHVWVRKDVDEGVADEAMTVLTDDTFRSHLSSVGGYDLRRSGERVE